MAISSSDLVRREVHYCVSSLVSSLAMGAHAVTRNTDMGRHLANLTEQAQELALPILDYEEAAREAGWRTTDDSEFTDGTEIVGSIGPNDPDGGWPTICDAMGIEPYDREVFEHWIVSNWLADKLEAKGEKVDRDFAGMTVWARTTTGQAISCDSVIKEIIAELNG